MNRSKLEQVRRAFQLADITVHDMAIDFRDLYEMGKHAAMSMPKSITGLLAEFLRLRDNSTIQ